MTLLAKISLEDRVLNEELEAVGRWQQHDLECHTEEFILQRAQPTGVLRVHHFVFFLFTESVQHSEFLIRQ